MMWDIVKFIGHTLVGMAGSLIVGLSITLVGELNTMSMKIDRLTQMVYDLRADVKVLQDRSTHK